MLNRTAAGAIGLYQRHLSPLKGFHCAYRCRTGRHSCSEYARRLALRHGLLVLLRALPRQFARCRAAYIALAQETPEERKRRRDQRRERGKDLASDCCTCSFDCGCCHLPGKCPLGPCDF